MSCGHVFHSDCITDYMQVTGKPKTLCCPLKCHNSMPTVDFPEPDSVADAIETGLEDLATDGQLVQVVDVDAEATANIS